MLKTFLSRLSWKRRNQEREAQVSREIPIPPASPKQTDTRVSSTALVDQPGLLEGLSIEEDDP